MDVNKTAIVLVGYCTVNQTLVLQVFMNNRNADFDQIRGCKILFRTSGLVKINLPFQTRGSELRKCVLFGTISSQSGEKIESQLLSQLLQYILTTRILKGNVKEVLSTIFFVFFCGNSFFFRYHLPFKYFLVVCSEG